MRRVNLIGEDNGFGLSRDLRIVRDVLTAANFSVSITPFVPGPRGVRGRFWGEFRQLWRRSSSAGTGLRKRRHDINIFFEQMAPIWFRHAAVNCLVPNPEWLQRGYRRFLPKLDAVLCKSRDAEQTFSRLGCRTHFTGFTSHDRSDTELRPDYERCFHAAGHSIQKGTRRLAEIWRRHPEWPPLTIVQGGGQAEGGDAPNLRIINRYLDDAEMCRLQNTHGIHLYLSEAEGFGHPAAEAASCRAVTFCTNAAPLNEIISPERGRLVEVESSVEFNLSAWSRFSEQSLVQEMSEFLALGNSEKLAIGERARAWFAENDHSFRQRLPKILTDIVEAKLGLAPRQPVT